MSIFNIFKKFKKKKQAEYYYSSSEAVSSGHPDRLADNLAAIVINDIQHQDGPESHAAVEVFITHDSVIFGGEVKTTLKITPKYLKGVVKRGFYMSGYAPAMREFWSKDEVLLAEDVKVVNKICAQSPDIALGTTDKGAESGWNDQGVYFSSAEATSYNKMGTAHSIAIDICESLQRLSFKTIMRQDCYTSRFKLGPDNKVVVTVKVGKDGFTPIEITAVTVAVAHSRNTAEVLIEDKVKSLVADIAKGHNIPIAKDCQWVINGTGRFVVHGPISDTSMTGRKISVNHPSAGPVWCNKMIGGGSLVKCWHASDLLLNLASRFIANVIVDAGLSKYAIVGCSGAIGKVGLQSIFIKGDDRFEKLDKSKIYEFFETNITWSPKGLATLFKFFDPAFDFSSVVNCNFYGYSPTDRTFAWEDHCGVICDYVRSLRKFIKE